MKFQTFDLDLSNHPTTSRTLEVNQGSQRRREEEGGSPDEDQNTTTKSRTTTTTIQTAGYQNLSPHGFLGMTTMLHTTIIDPSGGKVEKIRPSGHRLM
jgi:hypothetical protein